MQDLKLWRPKFDIKIQITKNVNLFLCEPNGLDQKGDMMRIQLKQFLFSLILSCGFLTAIQANAANSAKNLVVVDITERLYDGGPALAVILSDKLDPKKNYDKFIQISHKSQRLTTSWILGDNLQILYLPDMKPDTNYQVLVRRGLTSANGKRLPAHVEKTVKTKPIKPSFGFASQGSVLPERLTSGLPIRTVNVDAVDIEFLKVKDDKIPEFMKMASFSASTCYYTLENFHKYVDSVYIARFETNAKPNKRTITNIPVENIDQLQEPGLYIAVMRAPARFQYNYQTSFFFISDIGLHLRRYKNRLEIFASSLRTAEALPDTKILVYGADGKLFKTGYTDDDGRISIAGLSKQAMLVAGRLKKHVSFVSMRRSALDLSEYEISGPRHRALDVFIYAPRNLYRPGEEITVSALLRSYDGIITEPLPLEARVIRADGREIKKFTWKPRELGYYSHTFTIPADAPTGEWTFEIKTTPSDSNSLQTFKFKVEDFLPERMKVELETDQEELHPKDEFKVTVKGAYLYGAPAAGNRLKISAKISRDLHPVKKQKDFYFGNPDDDMQDLYKELGDITLKDDGIHKLSFIPVPEKPSSPMRVRVAAALFESGGRPVTRSISRTLWPAHGLVGIRPLYEGEYAESNGPVFFEIIKTNTRGELLAAKELQMSLIHEDREYFWEYDENRGWRWNYSQTNYPVYREDISIKKGEKGKISVPVKYGRYFLEISDPDTKLTTRHHFYAGWSWNRDDKTSARPDKVQLSLDKPFYGLGDTATVTITPPHAGEAIILVEADSPLWFKKITVPEKGMTLQIPISHKWDRHDIYISAVVLRPADKKKHITPNRALGIIHLPLDRSNRKLDITINAPELVQPEKAMEVEVKINNLKDKKTRVTVALVDVGVLNITNFKTPDPYSYYFSQHRYQVDNFDLYSQVIEGMEGKKAKVRFGGDADTGGLKSSKFDKAEVKILSLFSGAVDVDDTGTALVRFDLPDFNGTIRLMALAFSKDSMGSAETEIIVRSPVIAELSFPRFLASGDKSIATLDIHNMSGKNQELKIHVTSIDPIVIKKTETEIALQDTKKTTLIYPMQAQSDLGVGKIVVEIKGEDIDIKREWELSVRPAFPGVYRTERQILKKGEKFVVNPNFGKSLMKKTVEVALSISPVPPLNIRDAIKNLLQYPYGCLEQTSSRIFPLLFVDESMARNLNLKPMPNSERHKRVEEGFSRLAGMQKANGGFGLWSNNSPEEIWLTPYVAHLVLEAKDQGFVVPETMKNKVFNRLYQRLQKSGSFSARTEKKSNELEFASRCYAAYVLARVNRAPLGTLRSLYDKQNKKTNLGLPLVHLGIALGLQGDKTRSKKAIKQGLAVKRESYSYFGDYGSDIRDTAMIFHLLKKHKMDQAETDQLIYRMDGLINNRRYFSTQERNAIFLAGMNLMSSSKQWSGIIQIGDKTQKISSKGKFQGLYDLKELGAGIEFTSKADFSLYPRVEVTGYSEHTPKQEQDDRGIVIDRKLFTMEGLPAQKKALKVGEMLIAHIKINVDQNIFNGLVVDLLPAGLEIENQNLAYTEKLKDLKINGIDINKASDNNILHTEYRDDRFVSALNLNSHKTHHLFYLLRVVTPGTYTLPPPYVEDMYRPEIRCIGKDTGIITVENRMKQ